MADELQNTLWTVDFTSKADKQSKKLPPNIRDRLFALQLDLACHGPEQPTWRNYSKIVGTEDVYHCHLNSQRPRYVAVWKAIDREVRILEIIFVGPHGSVNYSQFR